MDARLQKRRRALFFNRALRAQRIACFADLAAVINHQVREDHPVLLRHDWDQIELNLLCRLLLREVESMREPRDVRVYNHTRLYIKRISQNDIRSLARDA